MLRGTVAAGDARTAAAGAELLRAGGNAVDAAVGATFAACVAEPPLTGPFGGGFVTFADRAGAACLEAFAVVPGKGLGAAREQRGLDFRAIEVDFGATAQVFHVGRGSVAVPRLLPGLLHLHREAGRLPLEQLIAPARRLAHEGVSLSPAVAHVLTLLEPILLGQPDVASVFAPRGRLLAAGERFVSPALGETFDALGRGEGELIQSRLLSAFGAPAGRLTSDDLSESELRFSACLEVSLGGRRVLLPAPPSAGGALVGFGLRLLESTSAAVWRDDGEAWAHLAAAMAATAAARARLAHEGRVPDATLLEDASVDPWRDDFARAVREGWRGEAAELDDELGSTTHISVVDAEGRMCSITSSNGEGCGHLVPGCGVMANNFLGEEDLHPAGFHRGTPGESIHSMMTPTVILDEHGRPCTALGTGGSNRIRTVLLQVIARHLLGGVALDEVIRAGRLHFEAGRVNVERRGPDGRSLDDATRRLAELGYSIVAFDEPSMYFGGVHGVDARGGGVGDPRRGGATARA